MLEGRELENVGILDFQSFNAIKLGKSLSNWGENMEKEERFRNEKFKRHGHYDAKVHESER